MPQRSFTRGCTLAAGAVAVCLVSGGTAFADSTPLPLPSPGDVLTTTQQTVSGLLPSPSSTPAPPIPTATPTAPQTVPQQTIATDSPKTAAVATRHATQPRVARRAAPRPATTRHTTAPAYAGSFTIVPAALRLPPSTEVGGAAAVPPAVAPLLVGPPARHAVTAGASMTLAEDSDAVLRGLLLTVALVAAAAVGTGHVWQLRRRLT